jgi:glycosyltransferase involved in cell wall biosynthesis
MNKASVKLDIVIPFRSIEDFKNVEANVRTNSLGGFRLILIHDSYTGVCGTKCIFIESILNMSELIILKCGKFGNPGLARNASFDLVQNEWVIFLDADDLFSLSEIIELANSKNGLDHSVLVSSYEVFDHQKHRLLRRVIASQGFSKAKFISELGLWRILIRREMLVGIEFPNLRWGEDQVFMSMLIARHQPDIIFIPKITYCYITGRENQVTNEKANQGDLLTSIQIEQRNYLTCINSSDRVILMSLLIRMFLTYMKHSMREKNVQAIEIIQILKFVVKERSIALKAISLVIAGMYALNRRNKVSGI